MKRLRIACAAVFVIPLLLLSLVYAFLPALLLQLLGKRDARNRYLGNCAHFIANSIMFFLRVTVHIDGLENIPKDTNACFMGNHQSILDIVAFYGPMNQRASILAKVEVKKIPMINLWCNALNCIYLDRKSAHDSIKAILKGVELLKTGTSILVFPEGTRSKSGAIADFRAGSFKLATRSKKPIVPFTVKGLRRGFEDLKGLGRVHACISVGKPIPTDTQDAQESGVLHDRVRALIAERFEQLP